MRKRLEMSSQKGNSSRSRPQKYQNSHAFKNNLHDTSHRTKTINNIQVANVCKRCKEIIEWKIKYKKYKPLKAPSKCTKCDQKCVKHAYHTMCGPCALQLEVCPKCGEKTEIIKLEVKEESLTLDRDLRLLLKKLPERKRRTFYRYMTRGEKSERKQEHSDNHVKQLNEEEEKLITDEDKIADQVIPLTRDDLLVKLQSLIIANERKKDNDDDDDYDDDIEDDEFDDFCKKMNKDVNEDSMNERSATTTGENSNNVNQSSNNNTTPGPIYYPEIPKRSGFTIGMPWKPLKSVSGTPGPYSLPPYKPTPAFSLRSRMKEPPPVTIGAGPYILPRDLNGPAFTIGIPFHKVEKIDHGPPPRVINFKWVTPRAPAFTLRFKPPSQGLSSTPGPYNPVDLKKGPAFSIGVKYNPCVFPYITSCDKLY